MIGTKGQIKECAYCEKIFVIGNSQFGFRRKYCSAKCIKDLWRRNNLEKHNAGNRKWREKNPFYYPIYNLKNQLNKEPINRNMLAKSSIAKGKLLENYIAQQLVQSGLDPTAHRTPGSGSGLQKGDVANCLNLNIECKNHKKLNFKEAWKQCTRDASISHAEPVLIWHPANEPLENSSVIISWDFFEDLLIGNKGRKPLEDFPKLKYPLMRLKQNISEVLKILPEN